MLLAISLLLLILCLFKILVDCRYIRLNTTIVDQTGYLPDNEDWNNIPDTIPTYDDEDFDKLPVSVSLEHYFPPIGDQSAYGTCVAWAVGYNLNTALNAIRNGWDSNELSDAANQTSPKDLWMGISSSEKGQFCSGTQFEPAFNVLLTDGAASMKDVPYKNMGSCNGQYVGDSTNTIKRYRHIVSSSGELPNVNELKSYINDTIPLVISAHLGDRFMLWSSDDILSYDTYLQPGAEHAYHAMVISGYDDKLNAFRVRNSWGTNWGDNGSIWIEYYFFINDFCQDVFMAEK